MTAQRRHARRLACAIVLAVVSCTEGVVAPSTGTLQVTVSSSGPDQDPDGFRVGIDDGPPAAVPASGSPAFLILAPGSHRVTLSGVSENCVVRGDATQRAVVDAGDTSTIAFSVACEATVGSLQVTASSSGSDIDPNGFTVMVDGALRGRLPPVGSLTLAVPTGSREVALADLTVNCTTSDTAPREAEVAVGSAVRIDFRVTCTTATPAGSGNEIAFVREEGDSNRQQLYLMNAEGTAVRQLLPDFRSNQYDPDWSPDGDRLVFAADSLDFQSELHVLVLGSSSPHGLVTTDTVLKYDPSWSPDGTRLAYTHSDPFQTDYFSVTSVSVVDADGSSAREVIPSFDGSIFVESPTWSPDGSRLAFVSTQDDFTEDGDCCVFLPSVIGVANSDGSNPRLLVQMPDSAVHPDWSRDGSTIAFSSGGDIYLVSAEGGTPVQLTSGPATDDEPDWSPDGSRIAFQSDRDGNFEIYVMKADGSDQTRLTDDPSDDVSPAWRP